MFRHKKNKQLNGLWFRWSWVQSPSFTPAFRHKNKYKNIKCKKCSSFIFNGFLRKSLNTLDKNWIILCVAFVAMLVATGCGKIQGNDASTVDIQYKIGTQEKVVTGIYSTIPGNYSTTLPNTLIIEPGNYNHNGVEYILDLEGLYVLSDAFGNTANRIVFESDVMALLSAISWIHLHGSSDDRSNQSKLERAVKTRSLRMTCGYISHFTHNILKRYGIKSRIVAGLTLDEWNETSNGHTLLEVWMNGRWVLIDIDMNRYFINPITGDPYTLVEFVDALKTDQYEYKYLAGDEFPEKDVDTWYKRVLQVALILHDKKYYFMDTSDTKRVESYSSTYKYVDSEVFYDMFYP